ncbi:hypothetical protein OAC39_01355 [Gammaproteobacteria bacterium]|jgi:hypothetical protein|nr:hypothetical protein [Gammaproteobacteria bacterium]
MHKKLIKKEPTKVDFKELHNLCFISKKEIYNSTYQEKGKTKHLLDKFSSRLGEIDEMPFIGYVGTNYSNHSTQIVFVSRAEIDSTNEDDELYANLYESFMQFKNSASNLESAYRQYADSYKEHILNSSCSSYLNHFFKETDLTIDDVAFVNAVPFKCLDNPSKKLYKPSIKDFTSRFFNIVQADWIQPFGLNDVQRISFESNYVPYQIASGLSITNNAISSQNQCSERMNHLLWSYKKYVRPKLRIVK